MQLSLSFNTCIHFVKATWISNFYYLPCATFTFIYYLYSFRHNYLEISLSFTTWICFTTCHEQFSLSFTTWIRSDFSQCFTSVSTVFHKCLPDFHQCLTSVSPLFQKCFKSVSKVLQKCFKSVSKLFVCIEVIAATRA